MSEQSKDENILTNYVFIATSLDGFIAEKDGGIDWLNEIPNPDKRDYGYAEFISNIDAIVMGRNSFEKILTFGFWPYEKPVYVLSNSLKSVPKGVTGKAEIVKGGLRILIEKLNKLGKKNLYIDGGRVIQSFLDEDLIDEMIISQLPILLGGGIPLFGKLERSLKFRLMKVECFDNTLVQCHYIRVRN